MEFSLLSFRILHIGIPRDIMDDMFGAIEFENLQNLWGYGTRPHFLC